MVLDVRRNEFYAKALADIITPDSVVLDLGAGLGVHGLAAAQLGAKRIYLVESRDIISVAREVVRDSGLAERVTCIQGKIEDIELPEKVDLIISVFTGNFLLSEDLLPSLFYARNRYLKPGGSLLPDAAKMVAVPVNATQPFEYEISAWTDDQESLDFSAARRHAANSLHFFSRMPSDSKPHYLAEPQTVMALDFGAATSTHCDAHLSFPITREGLCHGLFGWVTMRLGRQWLSTGPYDPPVHWSQAFLPYDPPLEVLPGEYMDVRILRPPKGEWTWKASAPAGERNHSTFFSMPMNRNLIRDAALSRKPRLNDRGAALTYLIAGLDGDKSVGEMSSELLRQFPDQYTSYDEALRFVRANLYYFD